MLFTNKKKKVLLLIAFIFFESYSLIHSQDNHILMNPFHDVFYYYNNNDSRKAKDLLKQLINKNKYKNHALINYGFILQYENKFKKAEKLYLNAHYKNIEIAKIYLLNLYTNWDLSKYQQFLNKIKATESSYWVDYEMAVYYLKRSDQNNAIQYLIEATNKGFNSTLLLMNDPILSPLKDSNVFKKLILKTKKNASKKKSIFQQLKMDKQLFLCNKPYGIIKKLSTVKQLEKKGQDNIAKEILLKLLKSQISFRNRNIALFWMARINAKKGAQNEANWYIKQFEDQILNDCKEKTGYKSLISQVYKDIILNDEHLKKIVRKN